MTSAATLIGMDSGKLDDLVESFFSLMGDKYSLDVYSFFHNSRHFRDENVKYTAAEGLALEIKLRFTLLSKEKFNLLLQELNRKLFEMVSSHEDPDRFGAIIIIDKLIEVSGEEVVSMVPRYANYLRSLLPYKSENIMESASNAIAKIVKFSIGSHLALELTDFEITRAFEWCDPKKCGRVSDTQILAACFTIRNFFRSVPALAFPYGPTTLDLIWVPLTDGRSYLRRGIISSALNEVLLCLRDRCDKASLGEVSSKYLSRATGILKSINEAYISGQPVPNLKDFFGAITAIKAFVGVFPSFPFGYDRVCEVIISLLSKMALNQATPRHQDLYLKQDALELLCEFARLDKEKFSRLYLNDTSRLLKGLLVSSSKSLQTHQFSTSIPELVFTLKVIKSMARTLKDSFTGTAADVLHLLKPFLEACSKHQICTQDVTEVYGLIMALSELYKATLDSLIRELIPFLLACDLDLSLRAALKIIVNNIPNTMALLENSLLDVLGVKLSSAINSSEEAGMQEVIIFTCETITTFDFIEALLESPLVDFLQELLGHQSSKIRSSAALSLLHLSRGPEKFSTVLYALTSLLTMVISDPDACVRVQILVAMNCSSLDYFFSQSDLFSCLLMVLNSGDLQCRMVVVDIIERITCKSPGLILPSFRGIILQLLADLGGPKNISEEAAVVLGRITALCHSLLKPMVEPLLRSLSPLLPDSSPHTSIAILTTLGRLVLIRPKGFNSHAKRLLDLVSKNLLDQSSSKLRLATLEFLTLLVQNVDRFEIGLESLAALLLTTTELLKTELVRPVRNEAIKLIGAIGALDPYNLRLKQTALGNIELATQSDPITEELLTSDGSTSSDEYYPTIAIKCLLEILRDASLGTLHSDCINAIVKIFKSLGVRSSCFLDEVILSLLEILKTAQIDSGLSLNGHEAELMILVLGSIADISSYLNLHIRPFVSEIVSLCRRIWSSLSATSSGAKSYLQIPGEPWNSMKSDLVIYLLKAFKALAEALGGERNDDLSQVLPTILGILTSPIAKDRTMQRVVLYCLSTITCMMEYTTDYTHGIILSIFSVNQGNEDIDILRMSLWCVSEMSDRSDFYLELPLIIRLINMTVERKEPDLKTVRLADRLACHIYVNFPDSFHTLRHQLKVDKLSCLSQMAYSGGNTVVHIGDLTMSMDELSLWSNSETTSPMAFQPISKLAVNEHALRRSWDNFSCSTKDDWIQWIRRFECEVLRESPSPSLRACANLASVHYPLSRKLFNSAFVSCWSEFSEELQDELLASLEAALSNEGIPLEVMQTILNLAEFMERDDRPMPIEFGTLGAYAMKCHAYAKALYYEEADFQNCPSTESVEALISINSQLQLPDAAMGILVHAQKRHGIILEESWFEKLQRWDEALDAYHQRLKNDPHNNDALLGIFRCWHALGDWDSLTSMAAEIWNDIPYELQLMLSPLAISAAWSAGEWGQMSDYVNYQSSDTSDGSVFRAVLAIKKNSYDEAQKFITQTRELLDTELAAMISESYNRAYSSVVRAQMLTELEEVIIFCKQAPDEEEGKSRRTAIKKCWNDRLDDCQVSVDVWQRLLKARSLIQPPEESIERWIKFAVLCQRNGRPLISKRIFLHLLHAAEGESLESLDLSRSNPMIVYGFLKYCWEIGDRENALKYLRNYTRHLASQVERKMAQSQAMGPSPPGGKDALDLESQTRLLARCYLKLGDWQKFTVFSSGEVELSNRSDSKTPHNSATGSNNPSAPDSNPSQNRNHPFGSENMSCVEYYLSATSYDKNWYRTWHGWALVNFEMAMAQERSSNSVTAMRNNPYLVPAIQGFIRSISLGGSANSLQDSLRLLTLWFKYGGILPEVNAAIGDGFHSVPVENWLQVIPQIIARIHVPSPQMRRLIHHLLSDIGKQHPQALIYPLTVASKSQSVSRKTAALAILDKMRSHSARLVEQAISVSQELIRVAILWEEMWYEGLEEASKLYFNNQDVNSMLAVLEPLHVMIERGYETAKERSFLEAYGGDLKEAREKCYRYKRTANSQEISVAWDLYYQVFRRISKALPQLNSIDLSVVAPKLVSLNNLELAIPGTYRANKPIIKIFSFVPTVGVISSKQRPRKFVVMGSDGERYKFLLKGHEDLRQDERVMQLFGLVNNLLEDDPVTRKRHLAIERFSVIPLSQNTGLIGWVPHCDTLHSLIRDHRDSRGILLSIEHRLMLQFAPDYDHLQLMNKVEVFDYAMSNTDGKDLSKIMWRRSLNSETWLEKRLAYTRSLALMCMVGYILGLGDRHPSNLMIDQVSGRVVHIDFGDCFEVAMYREKFPEKVPFRLTRMLVRAMEVSGVEGTFRATCEESLRVLRANKDSLMAVLEAFVYDPLINWRLLARIDVASGRPSLVPSTSGYKDVGDDGQFPENYSSSHRVRRDSEIARLEDESINRPEAVNAGALNVINRVSNKLTGKDFHDNRNSPLDIHQQVDKLIDQAMDIENLCQAYVGWCAFW